MFDSVVCQCLVILLISVWEAAAVSQFYWIASSVMCGFEHDRLVSLILKQVLPDAFYLCY